MHVLQVTLGAGATPMIPKAVVPANSVSWSCLIIQNNAAHVVRVGDSTVSASKGIALAAGSTTTQPALILTPALQYTGDLTEFYLFGTADDVIDVMILD